MAYVVANCIRPGCGKEYTGRAGGTCGWKCQRAYNKETGGAWKQELRTCTECAKTFNPVRLAQKTCGPDCYKATIRGLTKRTCIRDGKEFMGRKNSLYCGRSCAMAETWDSRRQRSVDGTVTKYDRLGAMVPCSACRTPFYRTEGSNQLTCSVKCGAEIREAPLRQKTCPICTTVFTAEGRGDRMYCTDKCSFEAIAQSRRGNVPQILKCQECGEDFDRKGDTDRKYCSLDCSHKAERVEREMVNCLNCGEQFERTLWRSGKRLAIYCSPECTWRHKATSPKHMHRCGDGHIVRSNPERLIDNWLFDHKVIHVYEPDIAKGFADWLVEDTYIEFYGGFREKDNAERIAEKKAFYADKKLIELYPDDLGNLDQKLGVLL